MTGDSKIPEESPLAAIARQLDSQASEARIGSVGPTLTDEQRVAVLMIATILAIKRMVADNSANRRQVIRAAIETFVTKLERYL